MQHFYYSINLSRPNEDKYGIYWNNRSERILDSFDQFSHISKYIHIYKIDKTEKYIGPYKEYDKLISLASRNNIILIDIETYYKCKLDNIRKIKDYLIYNNGGQELIKANNIDIIELVLLHDFPKLGLKVTKLSDNDVLLINNQIKQKSNNQNLKNKYENYFNVLESFQKLKIKNIKWSERIYQTSSINEAYSNLIKNGRFYLELATGGGKTYIVFKILSKIKPDLIICFSPRKKINSQNINENYISLLDDKYLSFNFSQKNVSFNNFMNLSCKKIITVCTQSYQQLFDNIKSYNIKNTFIWFDEAHWSIEKSWTRRVETNQSSPTRRVETNQSSPTRRVETNQSSINFWLKNTSNIKYRIFTSASPNQTIVKTNSDIFGQLYKPISISQLIKEKWLCPIVPYIFEYKEKNKVNLTMFVLDTFKTHNKTWGFSFHNKDKNAFNLFNEHYKLYSNNKTSIKPFLLIDFTNIDTSDIILDYDFKNETLFENSKNSIAYVVKKYDMGYNFKNLDYIVFSDPKLSDQDIIQCIGRGTRPDLLGENGKNLNKKLNIILPIFIENEETNKYKKVIEVLRYLILDLKLDLLDIFINLDQSNFTGNQIAGKEYNGSDSMKSKILDLLQNSNIIPKFNNKNIIELCIKYNIKNETDYNNFRKQNKYINFKENIYEYNIKWKQILDPNNEIFYPTFQQCIQAKIKILTEFENDIQIKKFIKINGWLELHKYDKKIPPFRNLQKCYYY